MPSPRAVFGWSYEVVLNFGAGIGRELLERRLKADGMAIPDQVPVNGKDGEKIDCRANSSGLEYESDDHALSRTTRDSFVCMIAEIDALRRDYYALGSEMMKYGGGEVVGMIVANIAMRAAAFFGGRALRKIGTKKWLKNMENKVSKGKTEATEVKSAPMGGRPPAKPKVLSDTTTTSVDPKTGAKTTTHTVVVHNGRQRETSTSTVTQTRSSQNAEATLAKINEQLAKNKHALDNKHALGRKLQDFGGFLSNAGTLIFILINEDVRVGLAGITLLGGFFFINLMFSFILIEQMLILGVALILFPFLAVCWFFKATEEYAVKSFQNAFSFAIGLVFLCLMAVVCIELNNWILGGMLTTADGDITTPRMAAEVIRACNEGGNCDVGKFVAITGTHWYFLYVLFAVYLNAKLLNEAPQFASWFGGGGAGESGIGKSLKSFGQSAVGYVMSGSRKFMGVVANNEKDATFIDRIGALFGRKKCKP
jgi:ribosome assembly protein YihI (activator of Der GTPase)